MENNEKKSEELRNQGQEINVSAIKGEGSWLGTMYDDGGFDYHIRPTNLEERNQNEIERRVAGGEDRDVVIDELASEYINRCADDLGIDPAGYVSADGRIYESVFDVEKKESEKE